VMSRVLAMKNPRCQARSLPPCELGFFDFGTPYLYLFTSTDFFATHC
jgi:hypothetical protein